MPQQMMMDEFKKRLQARKYKLTAQRQMVLQIFLEHATGHLSAEDVHNVLRQQKLEIGLATVYRSLELLSDLELLQKIDFGDGCSRYELNNMAKNQHHHHHLICIKCGAVQGFPDDLLDNLEKNIAEKSKFTIIDHQVKFYGCCQECQIKGENKGI